MDRRDALAGLITGFCSTLAAEGTPVSVEVPQKTGGDFGPALFVISLSQEYDADQATIARIKAKFEALFQGNPPAPVVVCSAGVKITVVPGQIKYHYREHYGEYEIEYGCQTAQEMQEFFEKRPYRSSRSRHV